MKQVAYAMLSYINLVEVQKAAQTFCHCVGVSGKVACSAHDIFAAFSIEIYEKKGARLQ